ncbi:hypothetical protein H2199_004006 [Coniosporium tulheliwenetii]|uniref:Uncharacterized protein n=1 Tax=Coniosporium tulheliwenetii TaxID=3383036 RepID=A0ACC2ZA30_9PEZI|nr:hypothetical protein H2199_004006 [Cladosporium sp. JES 115]
MDIFESGSTPGSKVSDCQRDGPSTHAIVMATLAVHSVFFLTAGPRVKKSAAEYIMQDNLFFTRYCVPCIGCSGRRRDPGKANGKANSKAASGTRSDQEETFSPKLASPLTKALVILIAIAPLALSQDAPQTLTNLDAYVDLRSCAKGCFYWSGINHDKVGDELSCGKPALNSCYCRSDLQSVASAFLSKCVSSACSGNRNDMTSAVDLYGGYCTNAGFLAGVPAATPAQTSTDSPAMATRTVVVTSYSTPTATSAAASGSVDGSILPANAVTSSPASPLTGFATSASSSTSSASSGTQTPSPSSGDAETADKGDGFGTTDIVAVVVAVLGMLVTVAIGIWQVKVKDSWSRRMIGKVASNVHGTAHAQGFGTRPDHAIPMQDRPQYPPAGKGNWNTNVIAREPGRWY